VSILTFRFVKLVRCEAPLAVVALGSLLRRREIVQDKRQIETDEVQLSFPCSYNRIHFVVTFDPSIASLFWSLRAIRIDMGEYPFC